MKWLRGSEEGDVVVRGGWAMAYQRPGLSDFTGVFGDNQGIAVSLQRDQNNATLPILLRNSPTLPASPAVTLPAAPASITTRGNAYDPDIQLPYIQSWSAGWQRKVSRDSAIELRYVGSKLEGPWDSINLNEPNITSNGFLNEFRQAQANLQANIAAGRGATFAYTGAGTAPLPIMLAHFNAQNAANAGNPALYTGANWTSATFLGFLAARNPNPWGFATAGANGLVGNPTLRNNAVVGGSAGELLRRQSGSARRRHHGGRGTAGHQQRRHARPLRTVRVPQALLEQLQRQQPATPSAWRRCSGAMASTKPLEWIDQAGQVGNVRHALKANWSLEVPVGHDRKFGADMNGFLDAIVGGWSVDGVGRVQTGETLDFGNVRLVGMTQKDLQKEIKVQQGPGGQLFILPADILDNTVKAFAVSATSASGYGSRGAPTGRYFAPANGPDCIESAPGYGDCGLRSVTVNGPRLVRFDIGISKKFDLPGRFVFEFRGEMLNAFNEPYFNPASTARQSARVHHHHHGPERRRRRHADGEYDGRRPTSTTTA